MGGNEGFHLMVGDEFAYSDFGIGGVVADDGQILHIAGHQLVYQCNGVAYAEEAAHHDGHAIVNLVGCFFN